MNGSRFRGGGCSGALRRWGAQAPWPVKLVPPVNVSPERTGFVVETGGRSQLAVLFAAGLALALLAVARSQRSARRRCALRWFEKHSCRPEHETMGWRLADPLT